MRCACIDIGSNTTRLLVAEPRAGGLATVHALRAFTRLGTGRGRDGSLDAEAIALTVRVVAEQVVAARRHGARHLRVVATAAVRDAPNGPDLCRAVLEASDVAVEVLTSRDEADHAFLGATACTPRLAGRRDPVGVVDVGGGSTELVVGCAQDGVAWSTSLRVGSGALTDRHVRGDPPSPAEVRALRAAAAEAFAGIDAPAPALAYAVGGSATSLQRLLGPELTPEVLTRGLGRLLVAPSVVLARRTGLAPERVRVLPAGLLVLEQAARALGQPLRMAGGGLREGLLVAQLARVGAWGPDGQGT